MMKIESKKAVEQSMYKFFDYYNNEVTYSHLDHPFSSAPKHVLVICKYNNHWLLTEHKERGLEFPGGKVEKGETAKDAAFREVNEETGGIVKDLHYVGQYFVNGKRAKVVKNVYFATIKDLKQKQTYYETKGPVLLDTLPKNIKDSPEFSFIMKDDVLTYSLKYINKSK